MNYLLASSGLTVLLLVCLFILGGCTDTNTESDLGSSSAESTEELLAMPTIESGDDSKPPVESPKSPDMRLPELNLQQGSAAEREPKQQPSVGDTTAVDDQRPRDSGRTVESLIEDMKRASAVDEETPQGQYNLAGKLLEDSLRLIDQGIASKEEIEKLQKESAEWRRKSALQGYLPAMLLLQGNEKELGAKEKLVWNLVRLHADMLVKRAKRDVTEMHPRNYYVIGRSARRLNASEVRDAVKEAGKTGTGINGKTGTGINCFG